MHSTAALVCMAARLSLLRAPLTALLCLLVEAVVTALLPVVLMLPPRLGGGFQLEMKERRPDSRSWRLGGTQHLLLPRWLAVLVFGVLVVSIVANVMTYARSRMDSPDPKRQRLEPTSSYNLRCRTLVTSSSIDPPDAKRQRLDTAASQSSTSTVGPPAVATDSRSVTFHVTFTAGPTETNEDRLFAGAQSRYGSFIAGVNTAGQGIVIMQIDDVILGRLESSHAFGHRVTFANVDAASLPPFITSRFAGVTVGQFKVSSATRISVEPSSAVPMLYSARLRFPVYDVGSDRARPEDKHASDGSALLLIPHGGMFRGGPFRKFKAWVACGNGDSPDAGRVELAIRESAPDDFVAQLQAAADSSTPLYVYGAKISPSNSKAYMNSVFLSGSLVAAASAPGKRPPKRVHTFQAAVQRTTAATVPADTTDMVLAWEQRSRSALVLPSDGPHASATLSPNPTSVTVVGSLPVLPLVLTIGSRSYPVCTDSIAVMQQLPNYDEFFGSTSFADDNDRMAYAAYDSFTVTGTITTKTEGLGAFRALVGSTPTQVGGVPRIYTGLHVLKLLLRQAFVLFSSLSSVRRGLHSHACTKYTGKSINDSQAQLTCNALTRVQDFLLAGRMPNPGASGPTAFGNMCATVHRMTASITAGMALVAMKLDGHSTFEATFECAYLQVDAFTALSAGAEQSPEAATTAAVLVEAEEQEGYTVTNAVQSYMLRGEELSGLDCSVYNISSNYEVRRVPPAQHPHRERLGLQIPVAVRRPPAPPPEPPAPTAAATLDQPTSQTATELPRLVAFHGTHPLYRTHVHVRLPRPRYVQLGGSLPRRPRPGTSAAGMAQYYAFVLGTFKAHRGQPIPTGLTVKEAYDAWWAELGTTEAGRSYQVYVSVLLDNIEENHAGKARRQAEYNQRRRQQRAAAAAAALPEGDSTSASDGDAHDGIRGHLRPDPETQPPAEDQLEHFVYIPGQEYPTAGTDLAAVALTDLFDCTNAAGMYAYDAARRCRAPTLADGHGAGSDRFSRRITPADLPLLTEATKRLKRYLVAAAAGTVEADGGAHAGLTATPEMDTPHVELHRPTSGPLVAIVCMPGTPERTEQVRMPIYVHLPQPPSIDDTIELFTLAPHQAVPFMLMARYFDRHDEPNPGDPLQMLVEGKPGTGKSQFVQALLWYTFQHGCPHWAATCAYSWAAATAFSTPVHRSLSTHAMFALSAGSNRADSVRKGSAASLQVHRNVGDAADAGASHNNEVEACSLLEDGREPADDGRGPYRRLKYLPAAVIVRPISGHIPGTVLQGLGDYASRGGAFILSPRASCIAEVEMPAAGYGTITKQIRRLNVPLGDRQAVTDYFVQGRSFKDECWLVDLAVPPNGIKRATLYVLLTRFKTLDHVRLLRPLYTTPHERKRIIKQFLSATNLEPDLAANLRLLKQAARETEQRYTADFQHARQLEARWTGPLQAAADSSTPLYVYGAKISPSNSKAYMNSVFLSGSLVAAASAPGKRPPKRVHTFQAAVQRTTAATVPADTTDMVLAWEQRSRSALVLPSDGPHASATLSPNPTSVTVVGSLPVLPLVLTIGSRSYPVCTDSIAVMQQLPNYDEFFGSTSFADDNDRMAYAAYDSFTVTGTITTKTEGRTTFITALQE
ncbi:hypothetical protein VOLCADRAFT_100524 [Volvox carteri f. nagariensis]|uniref:Uncharacterized protein n=1 Tax=Volvox carteri f. nagariensis TaxID=3068 RepID=D8UKE1_VOLCA|nr:uncharacterized protein VOLCADRAFT_100524 [Volvox carteri f. nagariensis]EFJ39807.1 hypothetical protein VOLCADRAFT_100524 [Volvox carteri f. nagariensis]|eukprot:XP_002959126.1 hypothetical protein VOLCADRAFT_100524 [Volvox carteri f. nagariensis]